MNSTIIERTLKDSEPAALRVWTEKRPVFFELLPQPASVSGYRYSVGAHRIPASLFSF